MEGQRTEDGYLLPLRRELRDQVLLTVDNDGGSPLTLVKRAVELKRETEREASRGRGRAYDELWCVFDRDEHPNIPEALELAAAKGIRVALSNPCIELWFILHFADQTAEIHRHAAQERAEQLLGCGKTLTRSATDTLYERHDDARTRAKALDAKHDGDGSPPRSNPSSDVWKLVDRAREFAAEAG